MTTQPSFAYWFHQESANPNPLCRVGGCDQPAVGDEGLCAECAADQTVRRNNADHHHNRWNHHKTWTRHEANT